MDFSGITAEILYVGVFLGRTTEVGVKVSER